MPSAAVDAAPADSSDLGDVPGSLVGASSCQQLAGNAKYSRVKLAGIGTVRVRAYTKGPAMKATPMKVTTQVTGGKAKKVSYQLDGRALRAKRSRNHDATVTPSQLQRIGIHTLKAMVTGKKGGPKPVLLTLQTIACRTLFTAQRWKTTAGAGLRLRVDGRAALSELGFKVPAALLPRPAKKARNVGFIRIFVAGQSVRQRFGLVLPGKGAKTALVSGSGRPTVQMVPGGLRILGLPARAAVAELTIYRVTKLDRATSPKAFALKAQVKSVSGAPASFTVKPKPAR